MEPMPMREKPSPLDKKYSPLRQHLGLYAKKFGMSRDDVAGSAEGGDMPEEDSPINSSFKMKRSGPFKQITIAGTGAEVDVDEGKTSSKFTVSPSYKIGDLKIGGEYKGTTSMIPFLGAGTETPTHSIKGTAHYSFGGSSKSWNPKTSFSGLITTKAGIESHKETTTTEYPYVDHPWRGEDETFSRSTEKIITTPTASVRGTLGVSKGEEKSCMVGDYFCGGGFSGFHLGAFGEVSTNKPTKLGLSGHFGALSGEVSYAPETKSLGGSVKLSVPLSALFGGK